jgi:hypothetical protein
MAEKNNEAQKRATLIEELADFGITGTSGTETITPLTGEETVEKLEELLKAAKKAAAAPKTSNEPITVRYRDHAGNPTERTYSKEVHGDDFAKLAEEFKTANADKIIA